MSLPAAGRRLAIATSADHPSIEADDAHLAATLRQQGVALTLCVWNDPTIDWTRFDAVLIRTIWDYYKHHDAFLAWLDQLDRAAVPTINNSALLRWNSDKRYLLELAQLGVPVIPTRLARAHELGDVLASVPGQQVVIKPTVSGGAWNTLRGTVGAPGFAETVARLPADLDYLVQPFVAEVVSDGEWSLLYFNNRFSHAVIKRPADGDYRVQGEHGGSAELATPTAETIASAEKALAAVAALGHGDHAYVRVDGVVSGGHFLIMELELIEPFLHLAVRPEAAEGLARDVVERMARAAQTHAV